MRKKIGMITLTSLALFLAACDILPDPVDPEEAEVQEEEQTLEGDGEVEEDESTTVEDQVSTDYYRPVVTEDGSYEPSQNRGITTELNSNINIKLFEDDLMRLSQDFFPTEDYFFQEGQYLPGDLATTWLERESEDNEEGLNPESTGSTDPDERAPNYLSSILEHNFYRETEDGLQLSGVSVGLSMNSVDYYPEYEGGPTLEQEIDTDELVEEGERMADEVVSRMREIEGLEDVPIMIGLYEQSSRDDLAGGVYVAQGISENGESSIESWDSVNEERIIFPLDGTESAEGNAFANFESEVASFFPNLSGVTGRAHYINDGLASLDIDIMTQFYGQGEMVAFTQYLNEAATTYLPENLAIEVKVESLNGIEAFLSREAEEQDFNVHVFN